jgi:hypothetical protein
MTSTNAKGVRLLIAALLIVAVLERVAWAAKRGWITSAGEATNVALALASGRGFADPYSYTSGATAHLMPTTPALAGAIYWLISPNTVAAEMVLQAIACAEMIAGYLLLFALFGRLGAPIGARLAGLGVLCGLPVFMGQESLDFRYWEGGLAVVLATGSLIVLIDLDAQAAPPSWLQRVAVAALFAATFFTSPPLGLAVAACSLILLLRKPAWPGRWQMSIVAAFALVLVLTPWTIRNYQVMGKPILLRSNMGLELALANNPLQANEANKAAFDRSMVRLHPSVAGPGRVRMQQVGEVAYMAELSRATTDWISANPETFVRLCLRHFRQMFFPDAFQFEIGSGSFSHARAIWYAVVSAIGLLALGLCVRRGEIGYIYVSLSIAIVTATYVPFQPMARYLYLNYGLLVFAAAALMHQTATVSWARRRPIKPL